MIRNVIIIRHNIIMLWLVFGRRFCVFLMSWHIALRRITILLISRGRFSISVWWDMINKFSIRGLLFALGRTITWMSVVLRVYIRGLIAKRVRVFYVNWCGVLLWQLRLAMQGIRVLWYARRMHVYWGAPVHWIPVWSDISNGLRRACIN